MRTAISTHFYSSRGYHQGQVRRLSPTQNWTRRLGSSQFGRGKYPDVTKADGLGMGDRKVNVDAILSAVYRVRVRRSVLLVNSNALIFCFGFDVRKLLSVRYGTFVPVPGLASATIRLSCAEAVTCRRSSVYFRS